MNEPELSQEHALAALKEILGRALGAVKQNAFYEASGCDSAHLPLQGWDAEFAAMTQEKQVAWLLQLFSVLMNKTLTGRE